MAIVKQGNNLASVILQPGAKFAEDGYGLVTGTCVFKADQTATVGDTINRGSACPISRYSYLKSHKFQVTIDSLGIATYTVDYVGMNPTSHATYSDPQITSSQGLTSENITTHVNFFELATGSGFTGTPIAGVGTGSLASPAYASVDGTNPTEYEGNNGSRFEKTTGGKFLGFKKPSAKDYYGKTNYLAPQTSFSGHFYTTSNTVPKAYVERVGKTSGDGTFYGSLDLLPAYMGTSFLNGTKKQLLLAQVSVEDFGSLYKVNYEIRYNRDGYAPAVYAPA